MTINLPPLCQNEPTRGQNEALDLLFLFGRAPAPESAKNYTQEARIVPKLILIIAILILQIGRAHV